MSAKKLGRFTAGLFVALGLAFGGSLPIDTVGDGSTAAAGPTGAGVPSVALLDYEWG